jgi:enoyl-CoA hydratase/carnithine racemase
MYETIDYSEHDGVATIALRRARIDVRQIKELERALDHVEDVSACSVLVIRGQSLGIDFVDFDPKEPLDIHGFNKWEKLVTRLERLDRITVFAAEGPCVGGGFQLLLACDVRVAMTDARFSLPEVGQGFLPGMATWRLARYVGLGRAKRIVLTGESLDAARAEALGLLDAVLPDGDAAVAEALRLLGPRNVVAATLARRLLIESFEQQNEDALGNFLAAQARATAQPAFQRTVERERG